MSDLNVHHECIQNKPSVTIGPWSCRLCVLQKNKCHFKPNCTSYLKWRGQQAPVVLMQFRLDFLQPLFSRSPSPEGVTSLSSCVLPGATNLLSPTRLVPLQRA